jgi:ubiquinone/menaquinone biosynthesis C-methylase UbiE
VTASKIRKEQAEVMPTHPSILTSLDSQELAAIYDEIIDGQLENGRQLISDLDVRCGEHVLDIGAGTGRLAAHVAQIVGPPGRVVGIDPLPLRIEIATRKSIVNFEAHVGQAEDLSAFADSSFDVVYLNSVFHWVADKPRALGEIMRVLKPDGRVGLNCQDPTQPHESRLFFQSALMEAGVQADYAIVHPSLGLSKGALGDLLAAAGFISSAIEMRTFADVFPDTNAVIERSRSSTFGNFLVGLSARDLAAFREALPRVLESKATREGIKLQRYLLFATARKPLEA